MLIQLPEQHAVVTFLAHRAAPVQQRGLTQHAPAVGVTRAKPGCNLTGERPPCVQLDEHRLTRQVRLQAQLPRFVHQTFGAISQQQPSQQVFTALRAPLQVGLLTTLLHEHFSRHLHQFSIDANLVRLAGDTEHAHQLMVEHQGQIDARFDTAQAQRRQRIDLDHLTIGQHPLRPLMTGAQTLWIAAADNDAQVIHDIDVIRQNGHRPIDDILSQRSIKSEHERLPTRGKACNGWACGYILLKL